MWLDFLALRRESFFSSTWQFPLEMRCPDYRFPQPWKE